jgi:hypothetical protein
MRVFPKGLKSRLLALESSLSWLMTMSETTVSWHSVPDHEIKILRERVKVMDNALTDIYTRLNKYEN